VPRSCRSRSSSGSSWAADPALAVAVIASRDWRNAGTLCGEFMHEEPRIDLPDPLKPDRSGFSFALMLAAAAAVILVVGFYFSPGRQSPPDAAPPGSHFSFGPAERNYAAKIQLENMELSRAENFLHQEVTTLSGVLFNSGERALLGVEVTIEFYDELNQIALRESRPAWLASAPRLDPGERRPFDISFEHIPSSWNRQQPVVHVTGLELAPVNR
jgi:hypothetical protein